MFGVKGFGSVAKPRTYQYIPRFFDPDKEAWEKKKGEYKARGYEYGGDDYVPGQLVKRKRLHDALDSEKKKQDKMTLIIRVISFCFLFAIVCLLYKFFFLG